MDPGENTLLCQRIHFYGNWWFFQSRLNKFPSACIIFIAAFELLDQEISKHDIFTDKNIDLLIKPFKLIEIQNSLLNLAGKN